MSLVLPTGAVTMITADVRRWGTPGEITVGVETGGFLLAPPGQNEVSVVALAGTNGVLRAPLQFTVSGPAIEALSEWADVRGLRIRTQFHSHRHGYDLSPIDRVGGIRVEGFITTVIANFANPEDDPRRWGWWHFHDGGWALTSAAITVVGEIQTVTFDEDGTRE